MAISSVNGISRSPVEALISTVNMELAINANQINDSNLSFVCYCCSLLAMGRLSL